MTPPLHEFLPHSDDDLAAVAEAAGVSIRQAKERSLKLAEKQLQCWGIVAAAWRSPILEICAMQARAIFEAAAIVQKDGGDPIMAEIMVPLAATSREVEICKKRLLMRQPVKLESEKGVQFTYMVGTMIELPRASFVVMKLLKKHHSSLRDQ